MDFSPDSFTTQFSTLDWVVAALLGGLMSLSGLFLEPIQQVVPWLSVGILGLSNFAFCAVLLVVFTFLKPDRRGGGRMRQPTARDRGLQPGKGAS